MSAPRVPPSLDEANTSLPIVALHWFVLFTGLKSEIKVADTLRSMQHQIYLPVERRWSRHGVGRHRKPKKIITRPLLERYVFVGLELDEVGPEIRHVEGVERLVGKLGQIEIRALHRMMACEAEGLWDHTAEPEYNVGDTVRLTQRAGVLADWTGRIEEVRGEKVRVELWDQIMGKFRKAVMVSLDDLEAA